MVCSGEGERQVALPVTAVNAVDDVIPRIERPVRLKPRPFAPRYGALIQDWMDYYFKTVFINVHQVAPRGDRSVTAGKDQHTTGKSICKGCARARLSYRPDVRNALSAVVNAQADALQSCE
ncbi:hypothetical protein EDI29_21680 [Pectobacterium polonicum]|nr:hypothetical protein EDI29_21680 [Pectobacterium polonicum]